MNAEGIELAQLRSLNSSDGRHRQGKKEQNPTTQSSNLFCTQLGWTLAYRCLMPAVFAFVMMHDALIVSEEPRHAHHLGCPVASELQVSFEESDLVYSQS